MRPSARAARSIGLHRLRVLDQPDRGGELRVFETHSLGRTWSARAQTRAGNLENFLRQVIDPVELAATAGDENAFADDN